MRWPYVSRRAYDILEQSVETLRADLREAREQADRAKDELINRVGFSPVSLPVRAEMKEAAAEIEKYIDASQFEDVGSGMISEEILQLAGELAEHKDKPV